MVSAGELRPGSGRAGASSEKGGGIRLGLEHCTDLSRKKGGGIRLGGDTTWNFTVYESKFCVGI